jgi:carbon storage regulator CsrA
MLVISRKNGESVYIGGRVKITVEVVCGQRGKVRLHIDAPRDVLVLRGELLPHDEPAVDRPPVTAPE